MLHLDIAGHKVTYKSISELQGKAQTLLSGLRKDRSIAESNLRQLRVQERMLKRLLGDLGKQTSNPGVQP